MWVATRGAQQVGVETVPLAVAAAPVLGLCRRSARSTRASLHGRRPGSRIGGGDSAVPWRLRWPPTIARRKRPSERRPLCPRLVPVPSGPIRGLLGRRQPERLRSSPLGARHRSVWAGRSLAAGPGEVEIEVQAAGLNFRDFLNALGTRKRSAAHGRRVRGTVARLGEGVTGLQIGDEVVALTTGAFGTYAIARAELVVPQARPPDGRGGRGTAHRLHDRAPLPPPRRRSARRRSGADPRGRRRRGAGGDPARPAAGRRGLRDRGQRRRSANTCARSASRT